MVCLSCTATGERVMLAAEGFGNRHCFLENIADKNIPPDLSQCVFVIEQALSVRALQELVTAAGSESVCFTCTHTHFKLHTHTIHTFSFSVFFSLSFSVFRSSHMSNKRQFLLLLFNSFVYFHFSKYVTTTRFSFNNKKKTEQQRDFMRNLEKKNWSQFSMPKLSVEFHHVPSFPHTSVSSVSLFRRYSNARSSVRRLLRFFHYELWLFDCSEFLWFHIVVQSRKIFSCLENMSKGKALHWKLIEYSMELIRMF